MPDDKMLRETARAAVRNGAIPIRTPGSTIPDDQFVREKARAAVRDGTIPSRRPDGSWARPGAAAICSVCELPITIVQMEFQLHFARDREKSGVDEFHIHIRCFAAWELEQKKKRRT
jgi:hypothetical protein